MANSMLVYSLIGIAPSPKYTAFSTTCLVMVPDQGSALVQDQKDIDVELGHDPGRFLDRRLRQDMDHRGGHHIPCLLLRNDPASEEGQDGFFNLDEGLVLDGCRGRLGMASASEGEGDFSGIHFLDAAPGHEIDFILHLGQGKNARRGFPSP